VALDTPATISLPDASAEEARVEASVREVLAAADRLLVFDLDGVEPEADFSPEWREAGR